MIALEAEQAVIGICLIDASAVERIAHLKADHFAEPVHAEIWSIITDDVKAGKQPTYHTIMPRLNGALDDVGGGRYLADLADHSPSMSSVGDLASSVINAWQVRQLQKAVSESANGLDAMTAIDRLKASLQAIEGVHGAPDTGIDARAAAISHVDALYKAAETGKPIGLMTGLKCIDQRIGGLKRGHVITTGGRPSMGKSAFCRNVVFGGARLNPDRLFVYYALEMENSELSERTLSHLTFEADDSVSYDKISEALPWALDKAAKVAHLVPENMIIVDNSRMTVEDIRRDAWRRKQSAPIGAIVVDYVQLLTMPDSRGKNDAKILSEMTAEFKRMSKELACTIILVCQLNRNLENRDNKRPQMSDLRESGGFEQDANVILFPYREVVYERRNVPTDPTKKLDHDEMCRALSHKMTVICEKNRGGEIGDDDMWCSMAHDVVLNERPSFWRGA